MKDFSPASVENNSSIFGIGYLSSLEALFTVNLKPPDSQRDFLSLFITYTTGATHSENCTGSIMPSSSRHSNITSIIPLNAYESGNAL